MYANQQAQYMHQQPYGMQQPQQRGMPNANYAANQGKIFFW